MGKPLTSIRQLNTDTVKRFKALVNLQPNTLIWTPIKNKSLGWRNTDEHTCWAKKSFYCLWLIMTFKSFWWRAITESGFNFESVLWFTALCCRNKSRLFCFTGKIRFLTMFNAKFIVPEHQKQLGYDSVDSTLRFGGGVHNDLVFGEVQCCSMDDNHCLLAWKSKGWAHRFNYLAHRLFEVFCKIILNYLCGISLRKNSN